MIETAILAGVGIAFLAVSAKRRHDRQQSASELWAAGYRAALENQGGAACLKIHQPPAPADRSASSSGSASSSPAFSLS